MVDLRGDIYVQSSYQSTRLPQQSQQYQILSVQINGGAYQYAARTIPIIHDGQLRFVIRHLVLKYGETFSVFHLESRGVYDDDSSAMDR